MRSLFELFNYEIFSIKIIFIEFPMKCLKFADMPFKISLKVPLVIRLTTKRPIRCLAHAKLNFPGSFPSINFNSSKIWYHNL